MRGMGLFNLFYGTAGFISSISLSVDAGLGVSLWVMVVGAALFLGRDIRILRLLRR